MHAWGIFSIFVKNYIMEIWKTISGFDFDYEISNLGNVRGGFYKKKKFYKPMKQRLNDKGYYIVSFRLNGRPKPTRVHRLIAEAFIPNNDVNKKYINHINGIKTDNRIENLEWVTISENNKHAYKIGLRKMSEENKIRLKSLSCKRVALLNKDNSIKKEYSSCVEAALDLGLRNLSISRVARGERNHHKGLVFKYLD